MNQAQNFFYWSSAICSIVLTVIIFMKLAGDRGLRFRRRRRSIEDWAESELHTQGEMIAQLSDRLESMERKSDPSKADAERDKRGTHAIVDLTAILNHCADMQISVEKIARVARRESTNFADQQLKLYLEKGKMIFDAVERIRESVA
jgi:hypothetical protein